MSKQRQALELALEALQWNWGGEPLPTKELEAINAIREALAEIEKTEHRLQCWDANDPEHGALDPQELAEAFADNMHDDECGNFEVMVSKPLSNRVMRVELSGGEEREMSWEWVE